MSILSDAGVQINFDSNNPATYKPVAQSINSNFTYTHDGKTYRFPQGIHQGDEVIVAYLLDKCIEFGMQIEGTDPNVSGNWGYENRNNVNTGNTKSFHAIGAFDVNAPWNPNNGGWQSGRFAVPRAMSATAKSVGWLCGGDWRDPMHFESHATISQTAAITKVLNALGHNAQGQGSTPVDHKPPIVLPTKVAFPLKSGYFGDINGPSDSHGGDRRFDNTTITAWIQKIQRKVGVTDDGLFGNNTIAAVKKYQAAHHLGVDGKVGPATFASMFG